MSGTADAPEPLLELAALMRRLRAECGWKSEQTHRSLVRHLLEEAHETLEAVDMLERTGDPGPLREELGDLLLQVYFHAAIAEERGDFGVDDVAAGLVAKLRRRNPHVFGSEADRSEADRPRDARAVNELWEAAKAQERPRAGLDDGIPPTLPALLLADKVLDRLGRRDGTEPPAAPAAPGTPQAEAAAREAGEALLAAVAGLRGTGVDPEQALRDAVRRLLARSAED